MTLNKIHGQKQELNLMDFYPLGDKALLINFKQEIDINVHHDIEKLTRYLKDRNIEGIQYFIPAYCSLTIGYEADKWNYEDLVERIKRFAEKSTNSHVPGNRRTWIIPVCYDDEFALDLADLALEKQTNKNKIIEWHLSKTYRVYMLGFLPGFVYLGDLPHDLFCKRKREPRSKVPAHSVAIAGAQTGIYPSSAPGGWQIIGRTPVPTFYPMDDEPFLLQMGDLVRFEQINKDEFSQIAGLDYRTLKTRFLVYG